MEEIQRRKLNSYEVTMVVGQLSSRKIAPNPYSNSNPNPNLNLNFTRGQYSGHRYNVFYESKTVKTTNKDRITLLVDPKIDDIKLILINVYID